MKKVLIISLLLLAAGMLASHRVTAAKEDRMWEIRSVKEIERQLGEPAYVSSFPQANGSEGNPPEFEKYVLPRFQNSGCLARAYVIRKFPRRLMIVVVEKGANEDAVLQSKFVN